MNKEILKKLASVANDLDQKGATKLANEITDIMLKVAQLPPGLDEAKAKVDVFLLQQDFMKIQAKYNKNKTEQNILNNAKELLELQRTAYDLASDHPKDPRRVWAESEINNEIKSLVSQLRDVKTKMSNERFFEKNPAYADFLESELQKNINRPIGVVYDKINENFNTKVANDLIAALKNIGYKGMNERNQIILEENTFLTKASKNRYLKAKEGRAIIKRRQDEDAAVNMAGQVDKNITEQSKKYTPKATPTKSQQRARQLPGTTMKPPAD